jgi:hypothetical protein
VTEPRFPPEIPRRHAACHQASADFPGTLDQQRALRAAIHPQVFGSKFHQASNRFAQVYKATMGRSYVTWEFRPYAEISGYLAIAGMVSVSMNDALHPSSLLFVARHELGHLWDNHLLTEETRETFKDQVGRTGRTTWNKSYKEIWAEHCREWMDSDGATWPELTAMLLLGEVG